MDFFDAEFDSKHIYFLDSSKKESPIYLAFKSKLPATSEPYNFRLGQPHPVLLSFAKLLLEIYCGEAIGIQIGSDDRQIRETWFQLLNVVEKLKNDRHDSFLKAMKKSSANSSVALTNLRWETNGGGRNRHLHQTDPVPQESSAPQTLYRGL